LRVDYVAAFKLIGIGIPYKLAQSLQMFLSRSRLIVLFDEWDGHAMHRKAKQERGQARLPDLELIYFDAD
jgi:hypothetical protein